MFWHSNPWWWYDTELITLEVVSGVINPALCAQDPIQTQAGMPPHSNINYRKASFNVGFQHVKATLNITTLAFDLYMVKAHCLVDATITIVVL